MIGGRKPRFIYFGGGTPSYLSPDQLRYLSEGMKRLLPWDEAIEVTFEGEPGTLTDHKLAAIRSIGGAGDGRSWNSPGQGVEVRVDLQG